jgi:hypothetical protein
MNRLAGVSWATVVVIAIAWPIAWFVLAIVTVTWPFRGTATSESGGIAAIQLGINTAGALLLFGPPALLVILRAIAPRVRDR